MNDEEACLPLARRSGVLHQDLPDGVMVYDTERNQAHTLNPAAALVWRHCDGETQVSEITRLLQQELNLPPDEAVVWSALQGLASAHLLEEPARLPNGAILHSRRALIRRLGLAGSLALLLPLVESVVVKPARAHASGYSGGDDDEGYGGGDDDDEGGGGGDDDDEGGSGGDDDDDD
jgi:hypothetical protein